MHHAAASSRCGGRRVRRVLHWICCEEPSLGPALPNSFQVRIIQCSDPKFGIFLKSFREICDMCKRPCQTLASSSIVGGMKLKILPAAFLFGVMSWASGQITHGLRFDGTGRLQWTYIVENDGATITASTATGAVTIPSVLGGYAVKRVAEGIFGYGNTSVTSVVIPNSVTSINGAFENCTGLTSAGIPDSVTTIGVSAFRDCTGLTNVSIPDSVTSIGAYAFAGCNGLSSVSIPDSVTSIGAKAFQGCTALTSVSIPDSVTSIEFAAFFGCPNLKEVNIPLRFLSVLAQIFDPEVASRLMIQLQEEANPPWWKRILRIFQPQPT